MEEIGAKLVKSVHAKFKYKQKVTIGDLIQLHQEIAQGAKYEDFQEILTILMAKGVVHHVFRDVWRIISSPGVQYEFIDESTEWKHDIVRLGARPKMVEFVRLIGGLEDRIYASRAEIIHEMVRYEEFLTKDRIPHWHKYYYKAIDMAIEATALVYEDGFYIIKTNEKVKLTPTGIELPAWRVQYGRQTEDRQ